MQTRLLPLALAALLGSAATPALAQSLSPAEIARIDALVTKQLADSQTPAASIAVVRGGQLVWAKAYGTASPTLGRATPAMPFQIASNSKQFTAMALLMLEDEGKLDLDDPVANYLPDISDAGSMTLRQLLNHTSGLQDYWPQDYSFPDMAQAVDPQAILAKWAKKPLDYAPGTKWQYSNTGYVAAGLVVEKVSGMPLMEYLKRRIFTPLGMTSAMSQDAAIGAAYPTGYGRAALGPLRVENPAANGWLYAAGELSMTAMDLAKWNVARINRTLVPADDWAEQERITILANGTATNYGLGVSNEMRGGRRRVSHGGESVGFLSFNAVYPDDKVAVTVMTNSWSSSAYGAIASGIAEVVLAGAPVDPDAKGRAAKVEAAYRALAAGRYDEAAFTPNFRYYLTEQRRADFAASLGRLGEIESIKANGAPQLRGGFLIEGYTVRYKGGKTTDISVFTEPGASGRIEQFLVSE